MRSADGDLGVDYGRRLGKEWTGKCAPLLKCSGAPERHRVVFDRFPGNDQPVAAGDLYNPFEVHSMTPRGGQKETPRVSDGPFELGSLFGGDGQGCDFPDQSRFAFSCSASMLCSTPVSTIVRVASTVA